MVSAITNYMRSNGARFLKKISTSAYGIPTDVRIFVDKSGNHLATMTSIGYFISKDKFVYKSLLRTVDGMYRITSHLGEIIKLKSFKGKKNVIFPYRIDNEVEDNTKHIKRSFFFIKNGVRFEKTDPKDGLMLYSKLRNFKTDKIVINTDK